MKAYRVELLDDTERGAYNAMFGNTSTAWTTTRPTKPGEYWLSIHPSKRGAWAPVYVAEIYQGQRWYVDGKWDAPDSDDYVLYVGDDDNNDQLPNPWRTKRFLDDSLFDGAQWAERATPDDPFSTKEPDQFLILDTRQIVGNCAMFWRPDGAGYTCDLNDAGLYDKDRSRRDTDVYVPVEFARQHAVSHVRVERLQEAGYWSKPEVTAYMPERCACCTRFIPRGGWMCKRCIDKEQQP